MKLVDEVQAYLNNLRKDHSAFFFTSDNENFSLMGCIDGQLICFIIRNDNMKLTKKQIKFSSQITWADGEFYTIRSMDDIYDLAKLRGWHD